MLKQSCSFEFNKLVVSIKTCSWFGKEYLYDWIASLLVFVVFEGISYFVTPFHRFMPPNDTSFDYPREDDIVSNALLMILSVVFPLLIFAFAQIYYKSGHDCHHAFLGLFVALSLTNAVTSALKTAAGRYRPNFFSAGQITDGRFSFPSGHSSNSFCGFVFLILYLSGKFRVFRSNTFHFYKALPILSLLSVPLFISLSRTLDYHHHFSDIIGGALIGTGFSFVGYFLYYPSLCSANSHLPKSSHSEELVQCQLEEIVVKKNISSDCTQAREGNQEIS